MNTDHVDTIVIGGGQAGLAVGYHLAQRGLQFVILDAHGRIGDAWRRRWDSLRLFTPAEYDRLPGMRFPAPDGAFPTKDEMADYLEAYAARFGLPVHTGVRVERLSKQDGRFAIDAGAQRFTADNVVVAMSAWQHSRVPAFATELDPGIRQIHSKDYQRPAQLQDGAVLVVGAGNSGAEIALDAARGHATWLAGRDTGHLPFEIDGVVARLFARRLVLRVLFHRLFTTNTPFGHRARQVVKRGGMPLLRLRPRDLARAGVTRAPRMAGVRDGRPLLEDGQVLDVANVVWCTGYQAGLSWIDLPVFEDDEPRQRRGVTPVPGLYFVGLGFIYAVSSAMVHGVGRDADYVVRHIARHRRQVSGGIPRRPAADSRQLSAIERTLLLGLGLTLGCGHSPTAPSTVLGWANIAAGSSSTCAITTTGAQFCWGRGGAGQLGIGLAPDSLLTPTAVAGALHFEHAGIAIAHACSVARGGAGYCWGSGVFGRLGTGNTLSTPVPVPIAGGHRFTLVDVDTHYGCGLATNGAAFCWGDDASGRLGNGSQGPDSTPSPVSGGLVFAALDVGTGTACGVTTSGAAHCWGSYLALGNGGDTNSTTPVPVSGGLRFETVRVGNRAACAITTDRRLYCWGRAQAPLGTGDSASAVPVAVASPLRFVAVDVGQTHACAIAESGDGYCWGSNTSGELGSGATGGTAATPVLVLGSRQFTRVATAPFHTCGITNTHEAYCWGDNRHGQLGNGTTASTNVPVRVVGLP